MNRADNRLRAAPIFQALAAGALGVILCGCGNRSGSPRGPDSASGTAGAAPVRIVCGSPAVTEIVFALQCGDRVVGVSSYTSYPPEAKSLERIGGWINPNRERILLLGPEMIITQGRHDTLAAFAREQGIRFLTVDLDTLEDLHVAIESIAEALDAVPRGKELSRGVRDALSSVRRKSAGVRARRVLLLLERSPGTLTGLTTVGPGTFLNGMLTIAGGTNVFWDAKGIYPRVSKESLLMRNPEVILELHPESLTRETMKRLRADWQGLPDMPAVKNDRIVFLTGEHLLIPGPRVGVTAKTLAKAIHPELYRE